MTGSQALDRALRDRVEEVQSELRATRVLALQAEQDRSRMQGEIVELEVLLKQLRQALQAPVKRSEPGSMSAGWFALWSVTVFALLFAAAWYWYVTLLIVVGVGLASALIGTAVVLVLTAARMIRAAHD